MKGLCCVLAVIGLCFLAGHCEAGCFQNAVTLQAADYGDACHAPPVAVGAPCAASLASPYAAMGYNAGVYSGSYNGLYNGFNGYGQQAVNFLRQRFVNNQQVQPIVVLKEVRRAQPVVVKVKAKAKARRGIRLGALGAVARTGTNALDLLLLRQLLRP